MALIKCTECGKEISDTAKACPNCGAKRKRRRTLLTFVGAFVALLLVLSVTGRVSGQQPAGGQVDSPHPESNMNATFNLVIFHLNATGIPDDLALISPMTLDQCTAMQAQADSPRLRVSCEILRQVESDRAQAGCEPAWPMDSPRGPFARAEEVPGHPHLILQHYVCHSDGLEKHATNSNAPNVGGYIPMHADDAHANCTGPRMAQYEGSDKYRATCDANVASIRKWLGNENKPCDAIADLWLSEDINAIDCVVHDTPADPTGNRVVRYEARNGTLKAVTALQWDFDRKQVLGY